MYCLLVFELNCTKMDMESVHCRTPGNGIETVFSALKCFILASHRYQRITPGSKAVQSAAFCPQLFKARFTQVLQE
jgi:hypothetical protein